MKKVWQNIESELSSLGGEELRECLNPPASKQELKDLSEIGEPPNQLVDYLGIHNGNSERFRIIPPWDLLTVELIIDKIKFINSELKERLASEDIEFDDEQEARGAVRPVIWDGKWWPFADDGIGNLLCVDNNPIKGGSKGQIILWSADPPYVEVIQSSLTAFFRNFLKELIAGHYVFDAEFGMDEKSV